MTFDANYYTKLQLEEEAEAQEIERAEQSVSSIEPRPKEMNITLSGEYEDFSVGRGFGMVY